MKRIVAYIEPISSFVKGRGYRVAFVREDEAGFHWSGNWPYEGKQGQVMPWFWGPTLEDAQRCAIRHNARMGISAHAAAMIVARSMGLQNKLAQPKGEVKMIPKGTLVIRPLSTGKVAAVHNWKTGWQQLVFANRDRAVAFAAGEQLELIERKPRRKRRPKRLAKVTT